MIATALYND